jgi:hypothetical protein
MKTLFIIAILISPFIMAEEKAVKFPIEEENFSFLVLELPNYPNNRSSYVLQHYHFSKSRTIEKENITLLNIEVPQQITKKNSVFMKNCLILGSGDVIDLKKKKLVHDAGNSARLLECSNTGIIIFDERKAKDHAYCFNLENGKVDELDKDNQWKYKLESKYYRNPNQMIVSPDYEKILIKKSFAVYGKGETMQCVENVFSATNQNPGSLYAETPALWLDNTKILTQSGNGNFMIADLKGKTIPVTKIDVNQPVDYREPRFFRDGAGRIIYQCCIPYAIDLDKKMVFPVEWMDIGCGFEVKWMAEELKPGFKKKGMALKYKGKKIALPIEKENGSPCTIIPSEKCVLIVISQGFSEWIMVWNANDEQWSQIELPPMAIPIGWENPKAAGGTLRYIDGEWNTPYLRSIFEE